VSALRVALLDHNEDGYARELATALRAAGHEPPLLGSHAVAPLEALLRRRGFTEPLSHVPPAVAALARGEFDVAHAFTAPDAAAAIAWRRLSGCPVVFTCVVPPTRATVSDRRLRLWALARAVEESDALISGSEDARAGLDRWFATSPEVLAASDASAHERLYRKLLAGRNR
jgi:hypothetical protein